MARVGLPSSPQSTNKKKSQGHSIEHDEHTVDVLSMAKQIYRTKGKKEGWFSETIDKATYVFGTSTVCFLTFALTSPIGRGWLPLFHIMLYPLLCVIRYVQYHKTKSHYFLLDFCYWFNFAVTVYTFVPSSSVAFLIIFSLSNGTLPWTILMYQNALVFHSVDKLTSCYIHMVPMYISYVMRWYPSDTARIMKSILGDAYELNVVGLYTNSTSSNEEQITDVSSGEIGRHMNQEMVYLTLGSVLAYAAQQLIYGFLLNVLAAWFPRCLSIYKDKEMVTLYRYTVRKKNTYLHQLAMRFDRRVRLWAWFIFSCLFTLLTSLPAILFYNSKLANELWMVLVSAYALWNGATFYMEVFSLRWLANNVTRFTHASVKLGPDMNNSSAGSETGSNNKVGDKSSCTVVPMHDVETASKSHKH